MLVTEHDAPEATTPAHRLSGVFSPVVTPFRDDLSPDPERFVRHCRWLVSQGCGLAVFGTNSEANSLSLAEREALLHRLIEAGIPPQRLMPGTGACALPDAVQLTKLATGYKCGGVLMLPPFYYKGLSDEGLFRFFAELIERVGSRDLKIYLYHIPPVANVPITLALIEMLLKRYPETVVGIKDSSGDWANTQAMLDRFPGFGVFAGSETFLLQTLRHGGAGCISATANVNTRAIVEVFRTWRADGADARQSGLDRVRAIMQKRPMIPALKAVVAQFVGDQTWRRVRPPLLALDDAARASLLAELKAAGFDRFDDYPPA